MYDMYPAEWGPAKHWDTASDRATATIDRDDDGERPDDN